MANDIGSTGSGHPISVAVARLRATVASVAELPAWSLTDAETLGALVELSALTSQVVELESRLISHADTIDKGAPGTATWLANATRMTRTRAHAKVHLAAALASHDQTRAAVCRGEVLPHQARVITCAVDSLPVEHREQCEKHLLADAAHHDANDLKTLGDRVLRVVDPDAADAHEAEILGREERDAAAACRLTMSPAYEGKVRGKFVLSARHAAMFKKALQSLTAPKHVRAAGGTYDHGRPSPERMGAAFCELIESLDPESLPDMGGTNVTVVVTMTLDSLLGGIAAASLDTGERITAGEARRMACQAGIIPVVLGAGSTVLDLGRTARFHSRAQRLAIRLEQQHCQHTGCDVPGRFCHIHHTDPWSTGGHTNTVAAALLCPRHHARVHRGDPPTRT